MSSTSWTRASNPAAFMWSTHLLQQPQVGDLKTESTGFCWAAELHSVAITATRIAIARRTMRLTWRRFMLISLSVRRRNRSSKIASRRKNSRIDFDTLPQYLLRLTVDGGSNDTCSSRMPARACDAVFRADARPAIRFGPRLPEASRWDELRRGVGCGGQFKGPCLRLHAIEQRSGPGLCAVGRPAARVRSEGRVHP